MKLLFFKVTILVATIFLFALVYKQQHSVKTGDIYIYSFDFESENPFIKPSVDTVSVLQVKNGYVLYEYHSLRDVSPSSCKLSNFIKYIKPIK